MEPHGHLTLIPFSVFMLRAWKHRRVYVRALCIDTHTQSTLVTEELMSLWDSAEMLPSPCWNVYPGVPLICEREDRVEAVLLG